MSRLPQEAIYYGRLKDVHEDLLARILVQGRAVKRHSPRLLAPAAAAGAAAADPAAPKQARVDSKWPCRGGTAQALLCILGSDHSWGSCYCTCCRRRAGASWLDRGGVQDAVRRDGQQHLPWYVGAQHSRKALPGWHCWHTSCRVACWMSELTCHMSSRGAHVQVALLGELNPSVEPWAGLGYLHFPGSEEAAKGCTHWLLADFGTKVCDHLQLDRGWLSCRADSSCGNGLMLCYKFVWA